MAVPTRIKIAGRPLAPILSPLAIALFALTLACDLAFIFYDNAVWARFAFWLLCAGLLAAALALIVMVSDLISEKVWSVRAWFKVIANLILLLAAVLNLQLRYEYGFGPGISMGGFILTLISIGGQLMLRGRAAPVERAPVKEKTIVVEKSEPKKAEPQPMKKAAPRKTEKANQLPLGTRLRMAFEILTNRRSAA